MSVKYTVIKSNVSHRPHAENHGAAMPLVKEAEPGHRRLVEYLTVKGK